MTTCCRSLSLSQAKTAQRTAATQNAIDDFMEQFARMRQLTHLMVALNRAGHPQFERFHFVVHIAQHAAVAAEPEAEREPEAEEDAGAASVPPGESSLKLILAEVERVSALLDAWREALSAAREAHPALNFWSVGQLRAMLTWLTVSDLPCNVRREGG